MLVPAFVVLMDRLWNGDSVPGPLKPASVPAPEPAEEALAEAPASKGLAADAVDSILGQFYDPDEIGPRPERLGAGLQSFFSRRGRDFDHLDLLGLDQRPPAVGVFEDEQRGQAVGDEALVGVDRRQTADEEDLLEDRAVGEMDGHPGLVVEHAAHAERDGS